MRGSSVPSRTGVVARDDGGASSRPKLEQAGASELVAGIVDPGGLLIVGRNPASPMPATTKRQRTGAVQDAPAN